MYSRKIFGKNVSFDEKEKEIIYITVKFLTIIIESCEYLPAVIVAV